MAPPLPVDPGLDPGLEQVWRQMERRLRLMDRFGLIVVLVRDAELVAPLKARVIQAQAASTAVAEVAVDHPKLFAQASLTQTLAAMERPEVRICWLEAHQGPGTPVWDQARAELLSRLNERRGSLEASPHACLVLVLPEPAVRLAASAAPDLWHVRSLTLTLEATGPRSAYGVGGAELQLCVVSAHRLAFGDPLSVQAAPWMERWAALFGDQMPSVGQLQDIRIFNLAVSDGALEVQHALAEGRCALASRIASTLVHLTALRRADVVPHASTIGLTRDECLAQLAAADALTAQGSIELAFHAQLQATEAAQSHAQELRKEALGAMYREAALDPLWFAAVRLGRWTLAERALADLVAIRRGLLDSRVGGSHRALQLSLIAWAHVKALQGDWDAAETSLEQAMSLTTTANEPWDATADAAVHGLALTAGARLRLKRGDSHTAGEWLGRVRGMAREAVESAERPLVGVRWAALLPSVVQLHLEQGDPVAAAEAASLAVQLSTLYVDQSQRSSRSLWLHWHSLDAAKSVSPNSELDDEMTRLTMEWSARFPELPASPAQADLLSSGIPVPAASMFGHSQPTTALSDT